MRDMLDDETERQTTKSNSGLYGFIGGVVLAGVLAGVGFYFMSQQGAKGDAESQSIIAGLMGEIGEGEARLQEQKVQFEQEYEYLLQTVETGFSNLRHGCERIYDGYQIAMETSLRLEAELVQVRARALDRSNGGRDFSNALLDFGCAFGRMGGDEEFQDMTCGVSESLRKDRMDEYTQYPTQGRSSFLTDTLGAMPNCHDLLAPEFERLRRDVMEAKNG